MQGVQAWLKSMLKSARQRNALWSGLFDHARMLASAEGRSILWTRIRHPSKLHQTTLFTCANRYPQIFDLVASLAPDAKRILSFGCSTGDELISLRHRFVDAEIIGAEINSRARGKAESRVRDDRAISVVRPNEISGTFDIIFAMAVFQREPQKIDEMGVQDLTPFYPFSRFNSAAFELASTLHPGGFFCIANAQYRIEDSALASSFEPIASSPLMDEPLFGPDGRRIRDTRAHTVFRKR